MCTRISVDNELFMDIVLTKLAHSLKGLGHKRENLMYMWLILHW